MAIITLTSDFGIKDHHVASMKGMIYSMLQDAIVIDISHEISPFNLIETGYIVKNAIRNIPKNSINIIAVDTEYSEQNKLLAAEINERIFLTADNGLLPFLIGSDDAKIFEINFTEHMEKSSVRKFIEIAAHIARGGKMELIGRRYYNLKVLKEYKVRISEDGKEMKGSVLYIDNYGNVITNITKSMFNSALSKASSFEIQARNNKFKKILSKYNEINNNSKLEGIMDGQALARFNNSGYLELAVYRSNLDTVGGASSLLGLKYLDNISIKFS